MNSVKIMTLLGMMFLAVINYSTASEGTTKKYTVSKKRLQKRRAGLTSKRTHKRLEKALRYAAKEKYNHAAEVLIELLKKTKKRKYEFAQVWQNLGFVLAQKGDHKKGIKALENSLKINSLPYGPSLNSLYTIAQLHIATENYKEAAVVLDEWKSLAEVIAPEAYILMATAQAQIGNKELALKYVNEAIKTTTKPQEKWLQFALALNHEMKKYNNALKILVMLTSAYPDNASYWKQLSSTYLSLERDTKALATMELAYKLNHVKTESDLLNMVSLYLYLDMPNRGAKLLEKEMIAGTIASKQKNLELLSQAWIQAKERKKALVALENAATKEKSGNLFARKAFLHLEKEEWDNVIASINKGIQKGNLDKKDKVFFALGIAQYNKKNFTAALNSFLKAKKFAKYKKSIERWIEQTKMDKLAANI